MTSEQKPTTGGFAMSMTREEWEQTDVHKASTYRCGKCGEQFLSPDDVYAHLDAEHPQKKTKGKVA